MKRSPLLLGIVVLAATAILVWGPGCEVWSSATSNAPPAGNNTPPPGDSNPTNPPASGGDVSGTPQPPSFVFTKPSRSARVGPSEAVDVEWTAGDPAHPSTVTVDAVAGDGSVVSLFAADQPPGTYPGSKSWDVSGVAAGTYRLRGSVRVGGVLVARVFLTASITVDPPPQSASIRIVSPGPGALVTRGQVAMIAWDDGDVTGATVDVILRKDGASLPMVRGRQAAAGGIDNTVSWDTTEYPSGVYQIDAELYAADGSMLARTTTPAQLQVGVNQAPRFRWVWPTAPISINEGTPIVLTWETLDPEEPIVVIIEALPIGGVGSSVLVTTDGPQSNAFVRNSQQVLTSQFDNGGTSLGDYELQGTVMDGVNPPVVVKAPFPVSILARPGGPPPPGPNQVPTLFIDQPSLNRTFGFGISHLVTVEWRATDDNCLTPLDCSSSARLSIFADPDDPFSFAGQPNGNEILLAQNIVLLTGQTQLIFDTASFSEGTYTILGVLDDGFIDDNGNRRPPTLEKAPGVIRIAGRNQDPGNQPPVVSVLAPTGTRGFSDGERLNVQYRIQDPDAADRFEVTLVLDKDRIAQNRETEVIEGDPINSTAVYFNPVVLPAGSAGALQQRSVVINEDLVPPISETNALGEPLPYNIRLDVNDGFVNPFTGGTTDHLVKAYGSGGVFTLARLTETPTGLIDLRRVGRTLAGARFGGFAQGDRAGAFITSVPDVNGNNADELFVVAEGGARGYLIGGGLAGGRDLFTGQFLTGRFNGTANLGAIGFVLPGSTFGGLDSDTPPLFRSAVAVRTVTPNRPALAFGLTGISGVPDAIDDDPRDRCDCNPSNTEDGEPVYDKLRYVDADNITFGLNNMTCPEARGDGLPNTLSDSQDNQFEECQQGTDDDDLLARGPSNNRQDTTDPMDTDPDYASAIMSMVFWVPANNYMVEDENELLDLSVLDLDRPGQPPEFEEGTRLRGAWFNQVNAEYPFGSDQYLFPATDTEFGSTVGSLGGFVGDRLVVSAPLAAATAGEIWIFGDQTLFEEEDEDGVRSQPVYDPFPNSLNARRLRGMNDQTIRSIFLIVGEVIGDQLGRADAAGDVDGNSVPDLLAGAPNATRAGLSGAGVSYIFYLSQALLDIQTVRVASDLPGVQIRGSNPGDRLGTAQSRAGDFNGDGIDDVILGAPEFGPLGAKTGMAGVVFGAPSLFGSFEADEIGTIALPGIRFVGKSDGDRVGASVAGVGDFNLDGIDDIVIACPGQSWPSANIEFADMPLDGDRVSVTSDGGATKRIYEFDANSDGIDPSSHVLVDIAGLMSPVTAERRLREAMRADPDRNFMLSGRVQDVPNNRVSTHIISNDPDATLWDVDLEGTAAGRLVVTDGSTIARRGVTYLVFGRTGISTTLQLTLPDDVLRSNPNQVLDALIFIGTTPVLPGGNTATVDVVRGIGDFDGDGFSDIALGLPEADLPFESNPSQFRLNAGEAVIIYGHQPQ